MIDLSLNEVETLAGRAARGAGLAWGLADDVGRAARRMAEAGIDWTAAVLRLAHAPVACTEAVMRGAELADRPDAAGLLRIAEPALVAALAAAADAPRRFSWTGAVVEVRSGRIVRAEGAALDSAGQVEILITADPTLSAGKPARQRALASPEALSVLGAVIARLYVPASDRSRVSGAGAALDDND